jgi:8-oxo-dGTP diphosphatase
MILDILHNVLIWVLIAVLAFTLIQRRYLAHGEKKRLASLMFAGGILALIVTIIIIRRFALPEWLLPVVLGLGVLLSIRYRDLIPYSRRCRSCGRPVPLKTFLFYDTNLCNGCSDEREIPQDTE